MCHIWMLLLTCQNTTNPRICWILRRGCQALIACLCTLSHPSPPLTLSGTTALLPHPVKVSCLASVHHFFPPFRSVYYYSSFCFLFSHFYIFQFSSFFSKLSYLTWYNWLFCTKTTVIFVKDCLSKRWGHWVFRNLRDITWSHINAFISFNDTFHCSLCHNVSFGCQYVLVIYMPSFTFTLYLFQFLFFHSLHHSFLPIDDLISPFLDYDFGDIFPVLQSLPSADWEGGTWLFPPSPI